MLSPAPPPPLIAQESLDVPSPKREKVEEEDESLDLRALAENWSSCSEYDSDKEEYNTDQYRQDYEEEMARTGIFEIDFSKLPYWFGLHDLNLKDSSMVDEPETDRDFVAMLANAALNKYNAEQQTNLVLGEVLRATFHLSAGYTFYISFQVIDGNNRTIPYQAVVRHLAGDIEVYSCNPKP